MKKHYVAKTLYKEFERDFQMKIRVTKIPTNLVINSIFFLFCPFVEIKTRIGDLVTRNTSVFG